MKQSRHDFILKLIPRARFRSGIAPLVIGVFFLGGVELFFIGLLGEYILAINQRVLHRPLVVEQERLNFDLPVSKAEHPHHGHMDVDAKVFDTPHNEDGAGKGPREI